MQALTMRHQCSVNTICVISALIKRAGPAAICTIPRKHHTYIGASLSLEAGHSRCSFPKRTTCAPTRKNKKESK
eukprot:1152170-Pelagomonas_calceolata.AAC.12